MRGRALALALATGCATADEPPPHVLLVTLDTTRADALGAYGGPAGLTPHLDALAARGVVVDEAMSVGPLTAPAHGSILTGRYPYRHGLRNNSAYALDEDVPTLAEAFHDAGWQTGAFVSASVLDARVGLARGFDRYADDVPDASDAPALRSVVPQVDGAEVVADALAWAARRRAVDPDRPIFLWVHLYDAHQPHTPSAEMRARSDDPYLAEVAELDGHVGALLDGLGVDGSEPWLVSAIGDHGEAFGEHGEVGHGFFVYRTTLRVPWLLAGPGVAAGARFGAPASQVDLAATLAALAGVPWDGIGDDGEDLSPDWAGGSLPERSLYGETLAPQEAYGLAPLFVVQRPTERVILAPRTERYAWRTDPDEARDLGGSPATVADWLAAHPGAAEPPPADDAEQTTALEALGYIASRPGGLAPRLDADPKDHVGLKLRVQQLVSRAHQRPPAEAVGFLEAALERHPGVVQLHLELVEAHAAAGDVDGALAAIDRLDGDPASRARSLRRGRLLTQHGRAAQARAELEPLAVGDDLSQELRVVLATAQHLDGDSAAALRTLHRGPEPTRSARFFAMEGALLSALGRPAEAVDPLRRALELDPRHVDAMEVMAPVLIELGWIDEAVAVARVAWERDADARWPAVFLARVGFAAGGCPTAAPYLEALSADADAAPELTAVRAACSGPSLPLASAARAAPETHP